MRLIETRRAHELFPPPGLTRLRLRPRSASQAALRGISHRARLFLTWASATPRYGSCLKARHYILG
jgi:hypothetical protein